CSVGYDAGVRLLGLLLPIVIVGCVVAGCGGPPPPKDAPSGPATRFREGDWVTYRYTGTFTKQQVVLREEVKKRDGNKLRIEAHVRRGIEERRWVEVITDTPEHRKNHVIDELFYVDHEVPKKMSNPKNRDFRALSEWTWLEPDVAPTNVHTESREVKLGD